MTNKHKGFTIVELLIVIVVIGILAAISIVAYNGISNQANDSAVKSDLTNLAKKIGIFHAERSKYPTTIAELESIGAKVSKGAYDVNRELNFSYCADSARTGTGWAVGGISKSGKRFFASSQSPVVEYSSASTTDGNFSATTSLCSDLLAGTTRLQAGFYTGDPLKWRAWTGAN